MKPVRWQPALWRSWLLLLGVALLLVRCSRPDAGSMTAGDTPTTRPVPTATRPAPTHPAAVTPSQPLTTSTAVSVVLPATMLPTTVPPMAVPIAAVFNGGNVRSAASVADSTVLDQINAHEQVTLLAWSVDGEWLEIITPRQVRGWVHQSLLTVDPAAAAVVRASGRAAGAGITVLPTGTSPTDPRPSVPATAAPAPTTVVFATPGPSVVQIDDLLTPEGANAALFRLLLRGDRAQLITVVSLDRQNVLPESIADLMLEQLAIDAEKFGAIRSVQVLPRWEVLGVIAIPTIVTRNRGTELLSYAALSP